MGFFDNREFKPPTQTPQTLFGTRLTPLIGVRIQECHELMGGVSYIQEFGSKKSYKVDPSVFYKYNTESFKVSFGAFPRRSLIKELPGAILYDSLLYFNPMINGALFQYISKNGFAEAYIDWRSKQGEYDREIFTIVSNGRYIWKDLFFLNWNVSMNHFAKPRKADSLNVVDNFMVNPNIGLDFSRRTEIFDSLQITIGPLISLNRDRGLENWHTPVGFLGQFDIQWRFLGLNQTIYAGKNQLTFFDRYCSDLHYADPFYRAKFYSRSDIYFKIVDKQLFECVGSLNVHVAGGRTHFQQQLIIRFHIDQSILKNNKRKIAPF